MASPARIITLNIGSQTVGLADFRAASSGGVSLNGYKLVDLGPDIGAESLRGAHVQAAVAEAMQALGVKGGAANYSVSAQSVFTRFVKLPVVAEDKVDQIIQFEAQQNVPFPIHEVVWDYQLVGVGAEDKMEVVLVAIKADLLDGMNSAVEANHLKTGVVDVAPMALYNAFRYNYSDLSGCTLLIDIGARTTNLIFIESGKVFSRSIPIGGGTITAAVVKEFSVAAVLAEEKKKADAFVGLGGAYAEPSDPEVARLSKITRNTMIRLHAEITRSISFYRAQQQGAQPVRILLCGGTASLPYMREFFSEKLQIPIEFFNPLRNVPLTSSVVPEQAMKEAHLLGELVGLSLRNVHDCPMELNLRPASVSQARKIESKRPYLILSGLCILLSIAGWWVYFKHAAEIKREVVQQLQERVTGLQGFENRFKKVRGEIKDLEQTSQPFIQATEERQYWAALLEDLHSRLPELYIWITQGEPVWIVGDKVHPVTPEAVLKGVAAPVGAQKPGSPAAPPSKPVINGIRIRGLYLDNPRQAQVVDTFVANLSQSTLFEKPEVTRRSQPTGTEWAYEYEILVRLKKPLDLP